MDLPDHERQAWFTDTEAARAAAKGLNLPPDNT